MNMSLRNVVGTRYGLTGKFSVNKDVRYREYAAVRFYTNANGSISLRALLTAMWFSVKTDNYSTITGAEVIGDDGVIHSFNRLLTVSKNRIGMYVTSRQEFFENNQRYLYTSTSMYQDARKITFSAGGGGKNFGFSINFPGNSSHDQTSITIASGVLSQNKTMSVTRGIVNLNQGSLSSPSFTGDLSAPPEILQQVNRSAYFQPIFEREKVLSDPTASSAMQAVGIHADMTLNEAYDAVNTFWYGGPEPWRRRSVLNGYLAVGAAIAVGLFTGAAWPVVGWAALVGYVGARVKDYIAQIPDNQLPGAIPEGDMPPEGDNPMPPDAGIPMDDGAAPDPSGDLGDGQCIQLSDPPRNVVVPHKDFICV